MPAGDAAWIVAGSSRVAQLPATAKRAEAQGWRAFLAPLAMCACARVLLLLLLLCVSCLLPHSRSPALSLAIWLPLQGVTSAMLYAGQWGAMFAFHVEDMNLYSVNYLHAGAPRLTHATGPQQSLAQSVLPTTPTSRATATPVTTVTDSQYAHTHSNTCAHMHRRPQVVVLGAPGGGSALRGNGGGVKPRGRQRMP